MVPRCLFCSMVSNKYIPDWNSARISSIQDQLQTQNTSSTSYYICLLFVNIILLRPRYDIFLASIQETKICVQFHMHKKYQACIACTYQCCIYVYACTYVGPTYLYQRVYIRTCMCARVYMGTYICVWIFCNAFK